MYLFDFVAFFVIIIYLFIFFWPKFLLFALYFSDVKMQHSLSPLPDISPDKVNLQSTEDLSGTATNVKVKVHGKY